MHVLCSTSSLLLRSATLIAGVQGALHCLHHPRASAAVAATCASTARAPSPASRPQSVPAGAAAIPVSISSSDSQYCLHHYPPRQQPRYQHRHDQHRRLRLSPAQPMGKAYAPCLAAGGTRKLNRVTSNSVFEIGELRSVNGVMTRPTSYAQWPFRMHALV